MKNKQVNKKSLSPFPHNMAELRRRGSRGYNTARLLVFVVYIVLVYFWNRIRQHSTTNLIG